jgi:2,3,4,5-tetrahydropyridine-2,6-dicarboxylate N-succinyltransferase
MKYGGHAMGDPALAAEFGRDIALLKQVGVNPVVVHGGGPQINAMLDRLHIQSRFVDGLRVTDEAMVEVVEMVLSGTVNKQVTALINNAGALAVGISGKDGGLIRARKMTRTVIDPESHVEQVQDLGLVGEPEAVDVRVIHALTGSGLIPVVAPVGMGADGQTYNINSDDAAGAIAGALNATRLLMLTDVAGVLDANKNLIPELSAQAGPGRHRRRHHHRRHDPQGGELPEGGAAGRARRGDPGWPRAARRAAGTVHRSRTRHPDPPMSIDLRSHIEAVWERRDTLTPQTVGPDRQAIEAALKRSMTGELRVAEYLGNAWPRHVWLKQAVLLSFRLPPARPMPGPGGAPVFDKVPLKFEGWGADRFQRRRLPRRAGRRGAPQRLYRAGRGADAVLRQCRRLCRRGTMIDTWATVGSCAQIGANCHISGGTGIGGVLEPLQAGPVIIEDDCFIGARSEVAEGVIVERGSVIRWAFSWRLDQDRRPRDRRNLHGPRAGLFSVWCPARCPASRCPTASQGPGLACAVIVKRVDAQTRSKTSINDLLRD